MGHATLWGVRSRSPYLPFHSKFGQNHLGIEASVAHHTENWLMSTLSLIKNLPATSRTRRHFYIGDVDLNHTLILGFCEKWTESTFWVWFCLNLWEMDSERTIKNNYNFNCFHPVHFSQNMLNSNTKRWLCSLLTNCLYQWYIIVSRNQRLHSPCVLILRAHLLRTCFTHLLKVTSVSRGNLLLQRYLLKQKWPLEGARKSIKFDVNLTYFQFFWSNDDCVQFSSHTLPKF